MEKKHNLDPEDAGREAAITNAPTGTEVGIEQVSTLPFLNSHLILGGIEHIEVVEAWKFDYCLAQTLRYMCRRGRKGLRYRKAREIQDLKKAQWYLARRVKQLEEKA